MRAIVEQGEPRKRFTWVATLTNFSGSEFDGSSTPPRPQVWKSGPVAGCHTFSADSNGVLDPRCAPGAHAPPERIHKHFVKLPLNVIFHHGAPIVISQETSPNPGWFVA